MVSAVPDVKQRGRLREYARQAYMRWWLWYGLGRKDEMSGTDEHDPYSYAPHHNPPRYVINRTDNNNGANKIVWWAAAALVTLYLTLMTGAQVWMLNMLLDLQNQQSAGNAVDAGQNAVIAMMQEALRMLQQRQQ